MNRQIVARAVGVLNDKCFYDWRQSFPDGVTNVYSPDTTNIVVVRDPWSRAVSSFNDQIQRGYISSNTTREAFMYFLDHYATLEHTHHTGTVAHTCIGYGPARFDHIINLEDISSFARVARLVPAYGSLVETGWEHCTGGDPRLYMPGSVALHANKDTDMKYRLCSRETIRKVCDVFKDDYLVYARLGYPFQCTCVGKVSP